MSVQRLWACMAETNAEIAGAGRLLNTSEDRKRRIYWKSRHERMERLRDATAEESRRMCAAPVHSCTTDNGRCTSRNDCQWRISSSRRGSSLTHRAYPELRGCGMYIWQSRPSRRNHNSIRHEMHHSWCHAFHAST